MLAPPRGNTEARGGKESVTLSLPFTRITHTGGAGDTTSAQCMTSYRDGVSHRETLLQQRPSGGQHTLLNHICLKGQDFKSRPLITPSPATKIDLPVLLVQAAAE